MSEKRPVKKIVLVCTGNTCRSPMAEVMLRKRLADAGLADVEVQSAGVGAIPGVPPPAEAQKVLKRLGLDGSAHRSQILTGELVDWADEVLVMDAGHERAVMLKFPRSVGKLHMFKSYAGAEGDPNVPDPIGEPQKVYDACGENLQKAVEKLVEKLKSA